MFYVLRPQSPYTLFRQQQPVYVDPEDAYVEHKRREYLAALQQQQERHAYEQAVAAEEERHRNRLAALAHQERLCRHASHRRSLPPQGFACAGPSVAPTDIVRGRYNRQRQAPQFQFQTPECPHPQSQEINLEQLFAELFSHAAHDEPQASAPRAPVAPKQTPQPAPAPKPQQFPRVTVTAPTPVPTASTSSAPARAPAPPAAPAPAPAPARAEEPTEGHWSNAVQRAQSLAAITQIARTFETLQRTFTFPAGPLLPIPGAETPRLAYNPANAPIHAYEHALSELLSRLDAVESFGFRGVRELRKEVVVRIERELEALEKKVAEAIAAGASPVVKPAEVAPEQQQQEQPQPAVEKHSVTVEDAPEVEDIVMEEAEVAAAVNVEVAEDTAEGYDLDADDDTSTVVPAPVTRSELTHVTDTPMVEAEHQQTPVEATNLILLETEPTEPAEAAPAIEIEAHPESTSVETVPESSTLEPAVVAPSAPLDVDPIIFEPASTMSEEAPTSSTTPVIEVVAPVVDAAPVPVPEPATIAVDDDATTSASESESESEIEDAVEVTVSSDSDVEVAAESEVSDGEKDFEML